MPKGSVNCRGEKSCLGLQEMNLRFSHVVYITYPVCLVQLEAKPKNPSSVCLVPSHDWII